MYIYHHGKSDIVGLLPVDIKVSTMARLEIPREFHISVTLSLGHPVIFLYKRSSWPFSLSPLLWCSQVCYLQQVYKFETDKTSNIATQIVVLCS